MYCNILPDYSETPFVKVNLDDEAKKRFDMTIGLMSPMADLKNQTSLLGKLYRENHLPCYGGFLEDRSVLWRGFEESKKMIHLGIDINNLMPGFRVTTPCKSKVIHLHVDNLEYNGWGGRIILELETSYLGCKYLMYGHLAHTNLPIVGTLFEAKDTVGYIGDYDENGGWFYHLHVQLITDHHFNMHKDDLSKLDGYLLDSDFPLVDEYARDPTGLIFS